MDRESDRSDSLLAGSRRSSIGFFNGYGGSLVVVVAMLSIAVVWVIGVTSWDRVSDGTNSATLRNLVLAALLPPTAILALWRASVARRQAETARMEADTARHGLLNERFQKGVELLADDGMMVRIGGISTLQFLAIESPFSHLEEVVQLLCAFVRHPPDDGDITGDDGEARPDVVAAMRAAGECMRRSFVGSDQHLELDFSGANLRKAHLQGAYLQGAKLQHAVLRNADLQGANVSQADLQRADLRDASLRNANCAGAFLRWALLQNAGLNRADLRRANLRNANLLNAGLRNTRLDGANLLDACMQRSRLRNAFLQDAKLANVDLRNAFLIATNLRRANLRNAKLQGAELRGAILEDSIITSATFADAEGAATGLRQSQLNSAKSTPGRPPSLGGIVDAESGSPLVWNPVR